MKNFIILVLVIVIIILGISLVQKNDIEDKSGQLDNVNLSSAVLLSNITDDFNGKVFDIDLASSTLTWSAEKLAIVKHIGNVNFSEGKVILSDDGTVLGGEAIVDMKTINESENNQAVIKHLKSPDFFDVEKYPISKLVITNIEKQSDESYLAKANLTIRDITAPIEFTLNVDGSDEKQIVLETKFNVNRTIYGANFGSESLFAELGDKAIKDEFELQISLVVPQN